MSRLVIVDTRLWAYQTHHSKTHILKMLEIIADRFPYEGYTKLVWAFDIGKSKFHTDIYPLYKAHRKEQQKKLSEAEAARLKEFNTNYNKLLDILPHFGTVIGIQGFEADSIANILVETFQDKLEIILMTDDSDWLVHLGDNVKVVTTKGKVITKDNILEYKGFTPWQLGVYKNLVGEQKDRVWGLYRFGEVAFKKILEECGDNEDAIIEAAQKIIDKGTGGARMTADYPREGFTFSSVREMYDFNKVLNEGVRLRNLNLTDEHIIKLQFSKSTVRASKEELDFLLTKSFKGFFPLSEDVKHFYKIGV
jgi:5'-3' exonuclease